MSALPHKADIAGRWFDVRKSQQPISRRINCGPTAPVLMVAKSRRKRGAPEFREKA